MFFAFEFSKHENLKTKKDFLPPSGTHLRF